MQVFKIFAGLSLTLTVSISASAQNAVDTRSELFRRISLSSTAFTGRSVVVAVIDSGVDFTHPLIKDHLWVNKIEANGQPGVDDDRNGFVDDIHGWNFADSRPQSNDGLGHGTATAGIISSDVGIAPQAQIMDVQALLGQDRRTGSILISSGTGKESDVVTAVKYALKAGARIINLSLSADEQFIAKVRQAVSAEEFNRALFVIAAGNSNTLLPTPNTLPNVIYVGATTLTELILRRAYYSNYGVGVDIAAPAGDNLGNFTLAIQWNQGLYRNYNGTSSAAPVVSAAAALKLEQSPALKPHELKKLILQSASREILLNDAVAEGRLLNVDALLRAELPRN